MFPCHILNSSVLFVRYQSNTASAVLETITNIQPKESGGGMGETREAIVYKLSEDMLSKLPPDYIPHEVRYPFCLMHRAVFGFHKAEHSPGTVCFSQSLPPSAQFFFLTFWSSLSYPCSSILQNYNLHFSTPLCLSIAFSVPFPHLWVPLSLGLQIS